MKSKEERESYLNEKDDKFVGGAVISEWANYIICESIYSAFVNQVDVATIITSVACIEAIVRDDFTDCHQDLRKLIERMNYSQELLEKYYVLKRFRNKLVRYKIGFESLNYEQKEVFKEEC
jgi:hypothetical protein